jgi:hypothetical protein
MRIGTSLPGIYRSALVLWVEDPLVRDYLQSVWGDSAFGFLIGGGNAGIRPVVEAARQDGHSHVYGLVDRDFGVSNRAKWLNSASSLAVFVPCAHEVENYLIDPVALAGCALNTGGRDAAAIEARLVQRAGGLTWWMACRAVLSELRQVVLDDFPRHAGPPQVNSLATATDYISNSPWYTALPGKVAAAAGPGYVSARLQHFHRMMLNAVANGDWRTEFSGKELLRDIRDWVYLGGATSGAARDSDLAKAVGQWQRANNAVPTEVIELRAAIRTRQGLPP